MNKTLTKIKCTVLAAAAFSAFCAVPALAQTNLDYKATSAVNVAGTYTDLGTTGTAITVASNDDANSTAQNIGFTFNFNGTNFTQFTLNTNGFIKLGSTAISSATAYKNIYGATDLNLIAPMSGIDLTGAANQTTNPTEFRVVTTGTAPNRVTTIQYKNMADKATVIGTTTIPAQFATMNFQIKLYETSNTVEFVYGTFTGTTNTAGPQYFLTGLKGSSGAAADRLLADKDVATKTWAQTIFGTTYVYQGQNYLPSLVTANTNLPDAGRTFRFVKFAAPANDLAIQAVIAPGKVAKLTNAPTTIRASVKNTGSTPIVNRLVNLDVAGGNSFSSSVTITKLNPGRDTVITFAPFTPTAVSLNNFVEVTTVSDGDNTNNAKDANMIVTASTESWAQYTSAGTIKPFATTFPVPIGTTPATNQGAFLGRFVATATPVDVSVVRSFIPGPTFNAALSIQAGKTVYAVVLDANGQELGRSADKVLTSADLDKFVDFPILVTPTVMNQVYYAGIAVPLNSSATQYTYPTAFQDAGVIVPNTIFAGPVSSTPVAPTALANNKYLAAIEVDLFSFTSGTKGDLNAALVSVYPNPSNGIFTVSAKDMKGTNVAFEVRDLQGKLVYSASAAKDNATLDLQNVASGVYLLKVSTDAQVAVKRLVIE